MTMRRTAQRKRIRGRYRNADAVALAKWLTEHAVRYVKSNVFGQVWRDSLNRGAPPFMILTSPPNQPGLPGVAIYMWPGGYAHITDSQSRWIEHLHHKGGWCVLITHGVDEAVEQLTLLGYGPGQEGG